MSLSAAAAAPLRGALYVESHQNRLIDVDPLRAVAFVAASVDGSCTGVYAWRPSEASPSERKRIVAPRLATLRDVVSFESATLVSSGDGHALLAPTGRHAGVIAEWSARRERVVDEFSLAYSAERDGAAQPLKISSLAMAGDPSTSATIEVVGAARSTIFAASLDPREPHAAAPYTLDLITHSGRAYGKQYVDRTFTCVATTGDGRTVAGDASGALYLFSKIGSPATHRFEAAVDRAVTSVDATRGGRYVCATTARGGVLVVGPFEDGSWSRAKGKPPAVFCTLSAEKRFELGIAASEEYKGGRFLGDGRLTVAIAHFVLVFNIECNDSDDDADSDDDDADEIISNSAERILARQASAWMLREFSQYVNLTHRTGYHRCRIHATPAPVVAHHALPDCGSDVVALGDCVGALSLG